MNKKNTLIDEIHILKESSSLNKISSSLIKEIKKGDTLYDLPTNWEWVRFGDIASFELGKTPLTSNEEYWGSTSECYNWISISDLDKNLYDTDRKITEKAFKEVFRGRCTPKGTLLMSFKLTIGKVAIAPTDCVHNEAIISIYPYHDILKPYLKACIGVIARNSNDRVYAVKGNTLNKEKLANLLVPLPPKDILIKINDLLSSLDNKIEINNKINQELEELGQALYIKWFVNFDFPNEEGKPYKSSGGEMIESELGMIPKGWKIGTISDVSEFVNGYAFKSSTYVEDGKYRVITIKNVGNRKLELKNNDSFVGFIPSNINQEQILQLGDLLISLTGYAGRTCLNSENNSLLNQRVGKIKSLDYMESFIYNLFSNQLIKDEIEKLSHGSSQKNVSTKDIGNIKIVIPEDFNIFKEFDNITNFKSQILSNMLENKKLEELRDFLIPQLISGNLKIKDLEEKLT